MTEEEIRAIPFKLVLLGESATGKSSLVLRFVRGQFFEYQESTIGAAFLTQTVPLSSGVTIKFEIWDTAGQELQVRTSHFFCQLTRILVYYRGASCAIVVYDITSYESYNRAKAWVKELKRQGSVNIIISLAGNKCDLEDQRRVDTNEAQTYCEDNDLLFMEVSAKTARNINELFVNLARRLEHMTPEDFKSVFPLDDDFRKLRKSGGRYFKDYGINDEELEMEENERLQFLMDRMLDFPIPLKNKTIEISKTFLLGSTVLWNRLLVSNEMKSYDGMKDLSLEVDQDMIINMILGRREKLMLNIKKKSNKDDDEEEANIITTESLIDYYIFFRNLGMMMEVCAVLSLLNEIKEYQDIAKLFTTACLKLENEEIKTWFSESKDEDDDDKGESKPEVPVGPPPPPPLDLPLKRIRLNDDKKKIWESPSHILKKEQEKEEKRAYTEQLLVKFDSSFCHTLFTLLKNGSSKPDNLLFLPYGIRERIKKMMSLETENIIHREIQNADKIRVFEEEEEEEENEGEEEEEEEEEEGDESTIKIEVVSKSSQPPPSSEFSVETPFILKQLWMNRNKSSNLELRIKSMKEEEEEEPENIIFKVHKEVLVWKSNFFFHMLRFQGLEYQEMKEKGIILLEDMKKDDLDILLRVFYTGKAEIPLRYHDEEEREIIEDAEEEIWGDKPKKEEEEEEGKIKLPPKKGKSLVKKEDEDAKDDETGDEMKKERVVCEKLVVMMVSALVAAEKYMERESIRIILDKMENDAKKLGEEGILKILPVIGPMLVSDQSKKYVVKTLSFACRNLSKERIEYKIRKAMKKKKMKHDMEDMIKKMEKMEEVVKMNNIKIEEQNKIIMCQLEKIKILEDSSK